MPKIIHSGIVDTKKVYSGLENANMLYKGAKFIFVKVVKIRVFFIYGGTFLYIFVC